MNLRDLEYLVAVADHDSFRQAAAACQVSQPTLSTQVKKLEIELGLPLVERGSGPPRLTPAGFDVVARARHILREVDELRAVAQSYAEPETGRLRLGVFPTLGAYLMPHVVPGLRARFPNVTLLITEEKSARLMELLDAGDLDGVIVAQPVVGESLVVRPLFREELMLALPAGHPLAAEPGPVTAAAVAGEDVLMLASGHCLSDQVGDWLASVGGTSRTDHHASSLESMRGMVAAGSGITLLPALSVLPPVHQPEGVVVRRFAAPPPTRELALVWRATAAQGDLLATLAPTLVPTDVGGGFVVPLEA